MLDLARIVGFDWDEGNRRKNEDKHGVTQSEIEQMFLNDPLLLSPDLAHSASEERHHGLGATDAGRLLHVTFTLRRNGELIRVVSARDMSRKERLRYEQEE